MSTFNESDAFIGFQKDTPASVIFYATNLLRRACTAAKELETIPLHRRWLNVLQQSRLSVKQFNAEEADLPLWSESVSFLVFVCLFLLLLLFFKRMPAILSRKKPENLMMVLT